MAALSYPQLELYAMDEYRDPNRIGRNTVVLPAAEAMLLQKRIQSCQ